MERIGRGGSDVLFISFLKLIAYSRRGYALEDSRNLQQYEFKRFYHQYQLYSTTYIIYNNMLKNSS